MSSNIRLTIDLSAIVENWRRLSEKSFPAECAAVVKADAYGLGLEHVVPPLIAAGCKSFFVAHLEEGLDLRDLSPKVDIYILNGIPAGEERVAFAANLIPIVNGLAELERLKKAKKPGSMPIAVNIDSGIHRLGLDEAEVQHLKTHRELLGDMWIKLAMSHLVIAETPAHPLNRRQRERFCQALQSFPSTLTSLVASSGIYLGSAYHFDMVRPGAALFGINPTPYEPVNPMLPVVTLQARILQVHDVKVGETVGYGADYMVERPSRIATLAIGYADGISRLLSNRGSAFIAGQIAPFVGRVSMDLLTVDVTDIPADKIQTGMFAELIGPNLTLDAMALEAETIGYEILTGLGQRSSRVYLMSDRYESALQ